MPFPWAMLIGAGLGAASGYFNSGDRSQTITRNFAPLSQFLPDGMEFLDGGEGSELWAEGMDELLQLLADPGLSDSVKQSMIASVASGFANAQGAANRQAATTGGPSLLGAAGVEASRGKAQADMLAQFEVQDKSMKAQNLSLMGPILNFLAQIESIRFGNAATTTITNEGPNRTAAMISGMFGGAGMGADFSSMFNGEETERGTAPGTYAGMSPVPSSPGTPGGGRSGGRSDGRTKGRDPRKKPFTPYTPWLPPGALDQ